MDGYDWMNWIDEYHCQDYWHSVEDEIYDVDYYDYDGGVDNGDDDIDMEPVS